MKKRGLLECFLELMNFSFIGVTTFSIQLFLTVLLTEVVGVQYYFSYAIALVLAWSFNFLLNMRLTFEAKGGAKQYIGRFASLIAFNIVVNWMFVIFCVEVLRLHYFPAIIIVTLFMAVVNFLVEDFWVFKKKR